MIASGDRHTYSLGEGLQILRPANPLGWRQITSNWRERARAETCVRSCACLNDLLRLGCGPVQARRDDRRTEPKRQLIEPAGTASVVTPRLRFLDGGCVVPAAAAIGEVDGRLGKFGHSLGLAVATSPRSRPAPGRKLVDLGRSLIHTRLNHFGLPLVDAHPQRGHGYPALLASKRFNPLHRLDLPVMHSDHHRLARPSRW